MRGLVRFLLVLILISSTVGSSALLPTALPAKTLQIQANDRFSPNQHSLDILSYDSKDDFIFTPQDIDLQDDAFHGSDSYHFLEWWYFDALLNDGYSVKVSIQVLSIIDRYFAFSTIDVYRYGTFIKRERETYPFSTFHASERVPLITVDGEKILHGCIDNGSNALRYRLSLSIKDLAIDLSFIGCTQGWKGKTTASWWGVILPKAKVNGTIRVDNKDISVQGIGYHDHNWEVTVLSSLNFGWIWGKMNSANYTFTYSSILNTCFLDQQLLVINTQDTGYVSVHPDQFDFSIDEFQIRNGMVIPESFTLTAHEDSITLYAKMQVSDTHHTRLFGMINYWRYHIRCNGYITNGVHTESIDEIQIAEFIRFR